MLKMFENLKKAAADTFADDVKMLDIDSLFPSPDNIFEVNRIEEFAKTIKGQGGVKENLIVKTKGDNRYEIISGHRRYSAVRYLLEKGETVSRFLPCYIANYADTDEKMLDIILMNVSTRVISDSELWKSYEILNEILQRKKASGEKFGKVRDRLAQVLGVSKSQVRKIENIAHNAVPEVKKAIEKGDVSIHTANEIARLPEDKQQELIDTSPEDGIAAKDVKEFCKKGDTSVTFQEEENADEKDSTSTTFSESENFTISETSIGFINLNLKISDSCFKILKEEKTRETLTNLIYKTNELNEITILNAFLELIDSEFYQGN